jgi:hypothetical protein
MKYTWVAALLYAVVNVRAASEVADVAPAGLESRATQVIQPSSPLIWYHGRWDDLPSSWWYVRPISLQSAWPNQLSPRPGSGFKLAFSTAPTSLTINVGNSASSPPITVSTRFGDEGQWVTLNLTAGANAIPLTSIGLVDTAKAKYPLVFDVVTQLETGNARLELKSIELDSVSVHQITPGAE